MSASASRESGRTRPSRASWTRYTRRWREGRARSPRQALLDGCTSSPRRVSTPSRGCSRSLGPRGRADLFRLSSELVMELDDLLPVVEAGEILGFVVVSEGDLHLTPLGQTYADASILARKEMLSGRVLRLPLIAWIYETLQNDDDGRVAGEFFLDRLQAEFGDRARMQLDTAIQWGRHAELFAYDDDTRELYLES